MYYLDLGLVKTRKTFRKYFKYEIDRDKFERKLKYSKNLVVLDKGVE